MRFQRMKTLPTSNWVAFMACRTVSAQLRSHRRPKHTNRGSERWNDAGPKEGKKGYCHHKTHLFPTWHRPYCALYEASILTLALDPRFDPNSGHSKWCILTLSMLPKSIQSIERSGSRPPLSFAFRSGTGVLTLFHPRNSMTSITRRMSKSSTTMELRRPYRTLSCRIPSKQSMAPRTLPTSRSIWMR